MERRPSFDIFCRVVDNLGDAGVCWRLCRQLSAMGHAVRLWIDDVHALARIAPDVHPDEPAQAVDAVTIRAWPRSPDDIEPHEVVIEAFACTPPAWFIERMAQRDSLWINLEYLSAESWVESCHGLPSPQPGGVRKAFFFPGFTARTGGLLREPDLIARRDACLRDDRRRQLHAMLGSSLGPVPADARMVFLFCYADAPLQGLMHALSQDERATVILAPPELAARCSPSGNVRVRPIPYVAQEHFDTLLWCCDLNFVRGEDSLVRAIWAGLPMVWHIYKQAGQAHQAKLDAWLALAALPLEAQALIQAWNLGDDAKVASTLGAALAPGAWTAWQKRSLAWMRELTEQADLATQLLAFCKEHSQTR